MFPLDVGLFSEMLTTPQYLIYFGMALINGVLLFFASVKFLLVMQQCGYKGRRYLKWLSNKDTPYLSRLMLLSLLALLFFCVLNMCFLPLAGQTLATYVGFVSYGLFAIIYINTEHSVNAKIPLKKTKRLVRLCITQMLLISLVTFGLLILLDYLAFLVGDEVVAVLRFSLICGLPMLIPYLLVVANGINQPFERLVKRYYVDIAVNKLKKANVIKIGITGSFAKTSVKEILKTILSQKYRVLATPESYNTPLGIALTVKQLDSTHDVFIAEMGARSKGDIKELVNIVKPKYGALTGINNQHLESFGDIENTKNTKYELFENLGKDGVAFFGIDNENSKELSQRYQGEKYFTGLTGEDNFVTATDISTTAKGVSFNLHIKGEQPVQCFTTLLGKHSVRNICLASAIAYKIGLTPAEIVTGINRIQSIGHRLELLPNNKNIVIIDDSYNSSVDGFNASLQVLDDFEGRKIVVTPGLVELGKDEGLANFEMGKELAKHVDLVIIIGKHNAVMLINGLVEGGMDRENIKFAKSLNKGNMLLNAIMKEGDVVLFENDLPDNYN